MDAAELTRLIQELEDRVERLRALYEQYFMGLERIEPLTLRKEVDRRLWMLRREQIRNTGTRFRLQTIVQRYNTYQQYWQRIVREIESGTYQRDLGRAAQRFGEAATTALGRRRQKMFEKGQARRSERDAHRQQGHSAAPPDHSASRATSSSQESVSTAAGARGAPTSTAAPGSEPPGEFDEDLTIDDSEFQDPAPRAEPSSYGSSSAPLPPLLPRTLPSSTAAPAPEKRGATGALGALVRMPSERAPAAPRTTGTAAAPPSHVRAGPAPASPATLPRAAATSLPQSPASTLGASAPPRPGAVARDSVTQPSRAAAAAAVPAPLPNSAAKAILPAASALPGARPPRAGLPVPPTTAPVAVSAAVPAATVARSVVGPAPAVRAAPPSSGSSPTATPPGPPVPAAPRPAPAPAPAIHEPGISTSRLRQIYGAYVDAKRQANESTAAITYDKVAANLRETAIQLRGKHQGREVDFEVVLKNGKPVLKPILKG